jgi:hypothetical protein
MEKGVGHVILWMLLISGRSVAMVLGPIQINTTFAAGESPPEQTATNMENTS